MNNFNLIVWSFLVILSSIIVVSIMIGIYLKKKFQIKVFIIYSVFLALAISVILFLGDSSGVMPLGVFLTWQFAVYVMLIIIVVYIINRFGINVFMSFSLYTLLIFGVIYLLKIILISSGYCIEQNRYLTRQEKIDIAVAEVITRNQISGGYKYADLDEFYKLNPNCCELVDEHIIDFPFEGNNLFKIDRTVRAKGINTFVRVSYIDNYNVNNPTYKLISLGVGNCGEIISNDYIKYLKIKTSSIQSY